MCGIAGVFGYGGDEVSLRQRLSAMKQAMVHRGPDEEGIHIAPEMSSGVAVRRLSIVDLEHGSQPLLSEDESIAVVCSGEIYNHRQLRRELELKGHRFSSHSDCEVLVHLYEEEGVGFLKRLHGMFALAVLDRRTRSMLLARDPVGMKHLYWSRTAKGIVFASEAEALFVSGFVRPEPDWNSLGSYFSIGWFPSPGTAFQGVQRLRPGSCLHLTDAGVKEERYWIPRYQEPEPDRSEQDYASELKQLLEKAVATHLDADVPVGLFLSGGWDSSLITLYASRQSDRPLKSYSLVFPDHPDADESRYCRQVARQAQVLNREIEVRDADILNAFAKTIRILEEPIFTAPTTLHCLLSEVAGRELKVVLTGQGSDELFAGYPWLEEGLLQRLRRVLPKHLFPASPPAFFSFRWSRAMRFLSAGDEVQAHLELLSSSLPQHLTPLFHSEIPFAAGTGAKADAVADATRNSFRDVLDAKLSVELTGRLADGILFSDEKISMAHSLETRTPFLDLDVVEFAHRLPSTCKIRNGCMKAVLSSLARELPADVAARKKQGLHVPRSIYCSESLRNVYRETILETSLSAGIFDHGRLEPWVSKLSSTPGTPGGLLRPLFYFCLWWNQFIQRPSGPEHDH